MLKVTPKPRPVMTSQNHQLAWKALVGPNSCWLVKERKDMAVKAVARTRGESRRIRRAWVRRPFSANKLVSTYSCTCGEDTLTKYDEPSAHCSCKGSAASGLQGQEHGRDEEDTAKSREHAHGDVGNAGLDIVLSNFLEVEISIEARQPTEECDEELGQGRVDVHEELALDVLRSETTEAGKELLLAWARQHKGVAKDTTYWTSSKTTLLG